MVSAQEVSSIGFGLRGADGRSGRSGSRHGRSGHGRSLDRRRGDRLSRTRRGGRAGGTGDLAVVRIDDRLHDLADRGLAEAGGSEQLLGALLRTGHDGGRLRAGPLERLLDLGPGGVRELGRLVPRLLEQPVPARLGLAQLARRVGVGLAEQVAGLGLGGGEDLRALALRLAAVALDLGLALLELVLLLAHLLFGALELRGGRGLGVALERVGELGGGADQVQRVHADGMPGRLDVGGLVRGLEHAELRLQLGGVAAEGVERLAHALLVVALTGALELLHGRQRGQTRGRTL